MRAIGLLLMMGLVPAMAAPGQVKCSWDANTEPFVTGYRVLIGSATRAYTMTNAVLGRLTTNTTMQADSLPSGVVYLAVTAFAADGRESLFSKEAMWTNAPPVIPPPIPPPITPPANFKVTVTAQTALTPVGPWRDLVRMAVPLPVGGEKEYYRAFAVVEETE